MKVDSNFLLGLAAGVAVGAAAVYLSKEGKKDELIEDFNAVIKKLKSKVCSKKAEQNEVCEQIIIASEEVL